MRLMAEGAKALKWIENNGARNEKIWTLHLTSYTIGVWEFLKKKRGGTLVYLLEVPPQIEVPLGKIADFKRVKMVNTS